MPFAPQLPPLTAVHGRQTPGSAKHPAVASIYPSRAPGAGTIGTLLAIAGMVLTVNLLSLRTAGASDAASAPAATLDHSRDGIRAARRDSADMMLSPWTLSVVLQGGGFGNVTSTPGVINCGSQGASCTDEFVDGALVSLTAIADPKSTFEGWSGDSACADQFTISVDTVCVATFTTGPGEHVFADGFESAP